ncbi:hypothetical protein [Agrobacterium sp. NPDC090283]|uniref:hypothetical protein n=1 Tax=Agrobacterium sp. NPDC090283 TaxID=3363920 RepID=UPI00383B262F
MKFYFAMALATLALTGCSEKGSELAGSWKAKPPATNTEISVTFESGGKLTFTGANRPPLVGKWRIMPDAPPEGFKGIVEFGPADGDTQHGTAWSCGYKVSGDVLTFKDCDFADVSFKKV